MLLNYSLSSKSESIQHPARAHRVGLPTHIATSEAYILPCRHAVKNKKIKKSLSSPGGADGFTCRSKLRIGTDTTRSRDEKSASVNEVLNAAPLFPPTVAVIN